MSEIIYHFTDNRIKDLQQSLIEVNEDATHCVQLHPLYTNTGMSVDQLYAELVVREDLDAIQRTHVANPDDRHKIVKSPTELFIKDGKLVKNVFMLGQPGYGNTTFCLHLLKLWCVAKTIFEKSRLSLWQAGMLEFDFVFYVSLRHVDSCRSSVVDMICEDVFERDDGNKDVIRHVLCSPEYRCLIVVDGLDEWVIAPDAQTKLREKGIPNTKGLSVNCTVLFASRHWKVDLIQPKYSKNDIVVELLGLTDKGLDTIIQNVLINFFKLEIESPAYKSKMIALKTQLQNSKFQSSTKIPMLVTVSVFLGFDGNFDKRSVTGLALNQLDLLIRRAIENEHIDADVLKVLDMSVALDIEKPKIIQKNKYLSQCLFVLYNLGKIAFNDLISKTSHLVFKLDALKEALGKRELELALKVGIVSQMRAPGRFHIPKVSIEFFHKSMQEAMAALYIVCDKTDCAFTSLIKYCCSVDKVMEMSNVLNYMAGINPHYICKFSTHIGDLATSDQRIVYEREEIKTFDMSTITRAMMLYHMQIDCYREMTHTLSLTKDSYPSLMYHVTDVVLQAFDDDKVRTTCDIMRGCPDSILSCVMLVEKSSWLAGPVLQILPQCINLTTLQVVYGNTSPDPELVSVIQTLTNLQRVFYLHIDWTGDDCGDVNSRIVRAILQLPHLRHVKFWFVVLDDDTLVFTDHMTKLQKVELDKVRMSPVAWNRFVSSLPSVKHVMDTVMYETSDHDVDSLVVRGILQNLQLRHVTLKWVELDDNTLVLTDHMTELQKVELDKICMSPEGWNRFVNSLPSVKHTVDMTIKECDIDDETRNMINKSKHIHVTTDWEKYKFSKWSVCFTSAHTAMKI